MADGLMSAAAKETALKELYDKDSEQDTVFSKKMNAIQTVARIKRYSRNRLGQYQKQQPQR
jgi:hypothetical protein